MKKYLSILLIAFIMFSQLSYSSSIILAESNNNHTEEFTITLESGASLKESIIDIGSETIYDNLKITLPNDADWDEEKTKELTKADFSLTYQPDTHTLVVDNVPDSPPLSIKIVLNNLSEQNEIKVEGYTNNELVAKESLTFSLDKNAADDKNVSNDSSTIESTNNDSSENINNKYDDTVANPKETTKEEATQDVLSNNFITPLSGNLNVDIDVSPLNTNIYAGNDAAYKFVFKTTGSIAKYTNAVIRVDLPELDTVSFNQALSELKIAGVEPHFDEEMNQLIYEFDSISTGQTYENIIKVQTANGITPNATKLNMTASFEADQQAIVDDSAQVIVDSSTTISVSKNFTKAIGNDRNLPIPNSDTVWKISVDIPKKSIGQSYIEEGSKITVVDTIPNGLNYDSTSKGPEPDQSGNQLTWTFDAPSIEEQENSEDTLFTKDLEVVLTAEDNTVDQTLTNNVDVTTSFIGGNENSVSASDSVTIVDSEKATGDIEGNVYVPGHHGPLNGKGDIGPFDNKNPNPVVYDDALLGFSHGIAPLQESKEGDFRKYTTRYDIDPHLIFEEMKTPGGFVYRPGPDYPGGVPLTNDPVFNIEAIVDGSREVLVQEADIDTTYTRSELGISENARVSAIFLDFTYAPSGMLNNGRPNYYFGVEKGYTGDVTNIFNINGIGGEGTAFGSNTNGRPYNTDPIAGPRSAQIVPKPTDQPPIATVDVSLTNHQGSYVDFGDNRMSVNLTTSNSSTLAMNEPLEATVLLPSGVVISDNPDSLFYGSDGRESNGEYEIVSDNFNDTGRQLITFHWEDRLLRPGKNINTEINVDISEGAPNILKFDVYGFSGDEELTVPTVDNPGLTDTILQTDVGDLNGDGNDDQPRLKSGNEYYMSGQYNIQTEKLVRGALDDTFTKFGSTVPGGEIDYQLTLTNTTGDDISSMTLMDVLPSVGDLGITDNIDRGSQFTPSLVKTIQIPTSWEDRVDIYYSSVATPERDDLTRNTNYPETTEKLSNPDSAEAPDWTLASEIEDWSSIHAFKIELKDGVEWIEGEDITISFSMVAPAASDVDPKVLDKNINPSERAAWNSFAIATDQGQPVEPTRVGVYMNLDNSVQLLKKGEDDEVLQGAIFSLYNEDNQEIDSGLTTNEQGIIVVEDLLPGSYEFVETSAPEGYQLDDTPIPFDIEFAQQEPVEISKVNELATGSVELKKVGEDGLLLVGVEFELQDAEGKMLQDGLFTDENGVIKVNGLKPGSYQFVEKATLDGYKLDTNPISFEIGFAQNTPVELEVENLLSTGSVELFKIGEEGEGLEGAEFTLRNEAGDELQTGLTTDEIGQLLIEDLKPGHYELVETKAPFGHELDETPIPFEIVFDQQETLQLTMENEQSTGAVELTKTGEDGNILEGVEFELQDAEGNTLQENLTTDADGKLLVQELKPGNYQFVETSTIQGYDIDNTPISFDIVLGQTEPTEVSFENPLTPGAVTLTKVGEEGEGLEGAEFTLRNEAGDELQTDLTTDETGQLLIEDLKPGHYELVETKAPFGYQLDKTPIPFEIVFDQQETLQLTMENSYIPSTFELTKQGEDGRLLEGVVFELQDSDGETLEEGFTTDEQGKLTIADLDPGSYQLVETETIAGYDLDATPIEFDIGLGQTEPTEVSFENPLTPGAVTLTKVGEEGEGLEGAEFTLRNEAGDELQTGLITNETGQLLIEDLKPGHYELVETKAPFGHELDETPIPFEIVFDQQETLQLTMENEQSTGAVELTKTGEDGNDLEGVEFELQDAEGNTLQTGLETNAGGKLLISDLKPGSYQFVETEGLPGYDLIADPIEFIITLGQTEVTKVNAVNPLSTGSVELTKLGKADNGLSGAIFELLNEQGETLQMGLATDQNGKLIIEDLKPGSYQLVETEAPFGYELDSTPIPFEIDFNQAETLNLAMKNSMTSGSVELTKVDEETGGTLAGATFELQQEGKVLQENLKTDENGKLLVEDLTPGTYQFVETRAPDGYQLDSAPLTFTIDLGQSETLLISTDNTIVKGDFALTKVDFDNPSLPLAGVKFEVQDAEGNILREDLVTGEDGKLLIEDLRPGKYLLKETEPLEGYHSHRPISFTIDKGQLAPKKIALTNKQIRSGVELVKLDSKNKEKTLHGAEFSLKNKDGELIAQDLTTDENGMIIVDYLKPGEYYFTETKAPKGYTLDPSPIRFTIELGQSERTKVEVLNQLEVNGEEKTQSSLPTTATNIFNYTLWGALFVIGGTVTFMFYRRRRQ
ncbi:SpaA isopeptide-forming pilin-related protein [Gracilibacillus salinarum]|uniref:LPXTG cell wall anchor domain-containing protein n=1 Tax=Gracilibacillus salinarum TaxID=2932255 RepID=A0ABY4GRK1_9BACI|nr:SpaA isopeptide-forming pilin-related protein [Gracilibacillus salinarum]UOQ87028.1 hypothetical protein MUN87_09160 [Gracilibacillus salinarum]